MPRVQCVRACVTDPKGREDNVRGFATEINLRPFPDIFPLAVAAKIVQNARVRRRRHIWYRRLVSPLTRKVFRAVASGGGQWCPAPPLFEICTPHFTFGPPVAAYIQYCILKMCNPLLVFSPSWFLPPPAAKFWRRA